ncbi:MAG: hypothetical protein OEL79_06210 [Chromatiales bacterium]|nr:hypothetical protein [Chromatiales bacterium]
MIDDQIKNIFAESTKEWACDNYSASIRFVVDVDDSSLSIREASIELSPHPLGIDNSFVIKTSKVLLGQVDLEQVTKKDLLALIESAIQGDIQTPKGVATLPKENNYTYYSEGSQIDRWYYDLHLSISGRNHQVSAYSELAEIDNSLRLSTPPFDGLNDALSWLGLGENTPGNMYPKIDVRINPPVDLIIDESSLNNDEFKMTLHAHPQFNVELVQVAIRAVPGDNLNSRLQVASEIEWATIQNGRRIGSAIINIKNSDNLLAILMVGNSIVRRQWFLDPDKARSNRFLAVQNFDKGLKMTKLAVLDTRDSLKFENGIAALLFLLGFSPCVQLETDSPDLVVQTPAGRLVLVECTLKISDFSAKIGKLVDRRGSLVKELEKSGHPSLVKSVIVCRLPRDQIAAHVDQLRSYKTILITEEQLRDAFDRVRDHNDPDKFIQDAESALGNDSQQVLGLS